MNKKSYILSFLPRNEVQGYLIRFFKFNQRRLIVSIFDRDDNGKKKKKRRYHLTIKAKQTHELYFNFVKKREK
jgi:hypothetical protein